MPSTEPYLIQTDRLALRPFQTDDWRAVHAYASDPDVTRFLNFGPVTEEQARMLVQRLAAEESVSPRTAYSFAITLKSDGSLVGGCSLYRIGEPVGKAELLYLLNRDFWGRGYMAEAIRSLISFGFEELGLHRIFGHCSPDNLASARVMEKAGMEQEGLLRRERWVRNQWQDVSVYSVLSDGHLSSALNVIEN